MMNRSVAVLLVAVSSVWGTAQPRSGDLPRPSSEPRLLSRQTVALTVKAKFVLGDYSKGVSCAAVSTKGLAFVVAKDSSDIDVWRVSDGKREGVWKGQGGKIRGLGVSPSGDRLVSSAEDGTVSVWHTQGQSQPTVLKAAPQGVKAVAISNNEKFVAGGSVEKGADVYLWEVGADREPRRLAGPGTADGLLKASPGYLDELEFSPDGLYLAAAGDGVIILWSSASGNVLTVHVKQRDLLKSVSYCPNGALLGAGGSFSAAVTSSPTGPFFSLTKLHGSVVYGDFGEKGVTHDAATDGLLVQRAQCLPDGRHLLVVVTSGMTQKSPNQLLRLAPLSGIVEGGSLRGVAEIELGPAPVYSVLAVAADGSVVLQKTRDTLYLWQLEVKPL